MNAASSRSHSVFVLNVVQRQTDGSETVSHTTTLPCENIATRLNIFPKIQYTINDTVQCFNNHAFIFDDNSTIDYGTLSYLWQFGDGGSSSTGDTTYTYNNYATLYQIGFNVFSDQGCAATEDDSVYLYQNPVADFVIVDSAKCLRGNSFTFLDNSNIPSGTYTTFWTFGNGDTTSQTNPNYTYNVVDTFNVELRVTSDLGCQDSLIKQTITFPHPATQYKVNKQLTVQISLDS